jgi:hypothetical protein
MSRWLVKWFCRRGTPVPQPAGRVVARRVVARRVVARRVVARRVVARRVVGPPSGGVRYAWMAVIYTPSKAMPSLSLDTKRPPSGPNKRLQRAFSCPKTP